MIESILKVEFIEYSSIIRVSIETKVVADIMKENSKKSKLAYNSSLFAKRIISQIRILGENNGS